MRGGVAVDSQDLERTGAHCYSPLLRVRRVQRTTCCFEETQIYLVSLGLPVQILDRVATSKDIQHALRYLLSFPFYLGICPDGVNLRDRDMAFGESAGFIKAEGFQSAALNSLRWLENSDALPC